MPLPTNKSHNSLRSRQTHKLPINSDLQNKRKALCSAGMGSVDDPIESFIVQDRHRKLVNTCVISKIKAVFEQNKVSTPSQVFVEGQVKPKHRGLVRPHLMEHILAVHEQVKDLPPISYKVRTQPTFEGIAPRILELCQKKLKCFGQFLGGTVKKNFVNLVPHPEGFLCHICKMHHPISKPYLRISGAKETILFSCGTRPDKKTSVVGSLSPHKDKDQKLIDPLVETEKLRLLSIDDVPWSPSEEDIKTYNIEVQEINNIRFDPLQSGYGSYFLLSQQGLGKTFASLDFIYNSVPISHDGTRRLGLGVITYRILLAKDLKKRLEEKGIIVTLYNEHIKLTEEEAVAAYYVNEMTEDDMTELFPNWVADGGKSKPPVQLPDKIAVSERLKNCLNECRQAESVSGRDDIVPYILWLPETSKLFDQFHSYATHKNKISHNRDAFLSLIKHSDIVICDDADMDRRVLDILELRKGKGQPCFVINHAKLSDDPKKQFKYYRTRSQSELLLKLFSVIQQGKRPDVSCETKSDCKFIYKYLCRKFPDKRIKIYTSENGDPTDFNDVQTSWSDCDVLIKSSKVGAGVSYDVETHFHCKFVFGFHHSVLTIDELLQLHGRVRYTIDCMVYFWLPDAIDLKDFDKYPTDPKIIADLIRSDRKLLKGIEEQRGTLKRCPIIHDASRRMSMQYDVEDIWFRSLVVKIQNMHKSRRHRVNLFIHRIKSYGFQVFEPDEWIHPIISKADMKKINKARREFKVEKIKMLEMAPTDAISCVKAQMKIVRGLGTEEDSLIKFKEYWNRKCVTQLTTEELLLIEKKPQYIPNRLDSETANMDVLMIRDAKNLSENAKFATHELMQKLFKTLGMSNDLSHVEHDDCALWYNEIKDSLEPLFDALRSYLRISDCSLYTPADTINFLQTVFHCYTGTIIKSTNTSTAEMPMKYNVVIEPDEKWIQIYNKLDYNKYRDTKLEKYYNALYSTPFTDQEKMLIIKNMKLINHQFADRASGLGKAWDTLMTVLEIKEHEKVTFPDRDDMFVKYKCAMAKPMTEIKELLNIRSGSLETLHGMVKFLNTIFTHMNGSAVKTSQTTKTRGKRYFKVIIEPNPDLTIIYKKVRISIIH